MITAIILDFDGVLVESNAVKTAAFAQLYAGYPRYADAMMAYHLANISLPRREKFQHAASTLMGLPQGSNEAKEIVDAMAARFSVLVVDGVVNCPEVAGASRFLRHFFKTVPLFITSNTPQAELADILRRRGLRHLFTEVFGNPPVPKKAAIQRILSHRQLAPEQVVFVGDAPSDHEAAVATGLRFVGRDSGLFRRPDFPNYPDMNGVFEHLRRWSDHAISKGIQHE